MLFRSSREFAEADEVGATATFGEELAAPFVEQLVHIELCAALGGIEHFVVVLGGIVAAANADWRYSPCTPNKPAFS